MSRPNLLEALSDNIVVDRDKCIFCGRCAEVCVLDNIRMRLSPCRAACPLGVNCHGYVQLIARGDDVKARKVLFESLPFPGILARVCSHPCEDACEKKKETGEAVNIRGLKRYLVDGFDLAAVPLPEMAPPSGLKAAVVGSGPAGLMAAYELARRGHEVTVLEADGEPGGMLRWAIPEFRLPLKVLQAEVSRLERMGIKFLTGCRVQGGELLPLLREFGAVVLAAGCGRALRLMTEGEDLKGVYSGLPFLRSVREGQGPKLSGRVVVIGGGNVAVDAAQTALRLGAEEVRLVCLEAPGQLPAFPEAIDDAVAEGVKFECGWGVARLVGSKGRVRGLELQRCLAVFDKAGRFNPRFDSCENMSLEVDAVIVAIGQGRDSSCLPPRDEDDERPTVDPDTLELEPGIFAAGDLVSGPSSVVAAMATGREAAESAHRHLIGDDLGYGRGDRGPVETRFEIDHSRGRARDRVPTPIRPCKGKGDWKPIELPLDEPAARCEASRCYSCGYPHGKHRSCWFCLPCEVECPEEALRVEIPYLMR